MRIQHLMKVTTLCTVYDTPFEDEQVTALRFYASSGEPARASNAVKCSQRPILAVDSISSHHRSFRCTRALSVCKITLRADGFRRNEEACLLASRARSLACPCSAAVGGICGLWPGFHRRSSYTTDDDDFWWYPQRASGSPHWRTDAPGCAQRM